MALINCPDCKKKVSTTASACPHCGYKMYSDQGTPLYPEPKKFNISFTGVLVTIVLILLMVLALKNCGSDSNNGNRSTTTRSSSVKEWYEGGTLHKAKIADWKNATYRNKLATCADFMAKTDNTISMEELKYRAVALVSCIDTSVEGLEFTNDMAVSETAVLCIMTLEYELKK